MTYSALSGFWEEEIGKDTLDSSPDHEDDVGLPLNLFDGNRPGELVEKTGCVDKGRLDGHSLCSDLKGDDLDRVQTLKRGDVE